MKNKPLTLLFTCLLLTVILFSAVLPVGAQPLAATQDSAAPQSYINKETGYKALVVDEDMLLFGRPRNIIPTKSNRRGSSARSCSAWTARQFL